MTDSHACQMITDRLECLFAGNRKPWRVTSCRPDGERGYLARVAGIVHENYTMPIKLITGAPSVTITYRGGDTSFIRIE